MASRPATELAFIGLKPDVDLDPTAAGGQIWKEVLSVVASQEGYQRAYFGRQLEHPDILLLVIDWDDVSSHEKFIAAPSYAPFQETLGRIMASAHLHHVLPTPFPPAVVGRAPCTEVATFFHAAPEFGVNLAKFAGVLDKAHPDGYIGVAFGEVVEEIEKYSEIGKEGAEKGKAAMAFIGWESKEKHLEFRETTTFKENVGLLRQGSAGAEVFHVAFKSAQSFLEK